MSTRKCSQINCQKVRLKLSDYLDNDLEKPLRKDIERHLRDCRSCAALYDSTRNILSLCRDKRLADPPPGYCDRLHTFLAQRMRE